MRQVPTLRGFRPRKLIPAVALGATALAAAVAPPVQAAGPPQTINKEVEMNCSLVTPFFTVPNLQLFVRVHAVVPSNVSLGDSVMIEESYAVIRIPAQTAGALTVVSADTVAGIANVFNLSLTKATPSPLNVTADPVAYGPKLVPPGQETLLRVPNEGVLPDVGPITAAPGTAVGDVIEARLTRLETALRATNSTNPAIDQTLPFLCNDAPAVPPAGTTFPPPPVNNNLVSSIPVVAAPAPPTISSLVPNSGTESGGTNVVLNGTNLAGAQVTVGGTAVNETVNAAGTQVSFTTPPRAPGSAPVVVTTAAGTASTTFTYTANPVPAPTISSITPNSGTESGGTAVVIAGANLGGAQVTVGGTAVTETVNAAGTQVSFSTPPNTPGAKPVVVTTATGSASTTFTYTANPIPAPTITSISPSSGTESGGTAVVITGTNLGGAQVTIGGTAVNETVNAANTQVSFTTPARAPGAAPVVVTTATGSASTTFTYTANPVPAPTISSITPNSGSVDGGTAVVIAGANLGGAQVTIGGAAVTETVNAAGTQVSFTTPARAAGAAPVVVTTATGSASTTFTYTANPIPAPTITSIAPNSGSVDGGTSVVITGTNLGGAQVTVGGTGVTETINAAGTTVSFATPAGTAGAKPVVVTTASGSASTTFTYTANPVPAPTISSIVPNSGTESGGTNVVINGANLGGAQVTIGGVAVTETVNAAGTTVSFATPARAPGAAPVVVTTATGSASTTFTYTANPVPAPTISAIAPSSGSVDGGTAVVITGTNLGGAQVTIGGAAVTETVNAAGTQVSFSTPAGTAGAKSVVVTTATGSASTTFTYTANPVPAPTITSIAPNSGSVSGGTNVVITGANLGGAQVTVGGTAVTETVNAAGTQVSFATPAGTAGAKTVTVTTATGSANTTFTYTANPVPAPTISSITPNSGSESGGTAVTIAGANLAGAQVTIGGAAVTETVNAAGTQVSFTTPARAPGAAPVVVTTATGSASTTFTYTANPVPGDELPTITKLLPNQALAYIGGITLVTGTNLDTASAVKVGGKSAQFVKVSPTQLLVLLPALKKGTYDLTVTNADGTSQSSAASKVKYISLW